MRTHAIPWKLRLARSLVAVASAALGFLGLAYSEFAPLGQVISAGTAARQVWLIGSACLLLLASALCFLPAVLPAVLIISGYEVAWAILSTPQIRVNPLSIGAWYGFSEALSSLVAPAMLYVAYQSQVAQNSGVPPPAQRASTAARIPPTAGTPNEAVTLTAARIVTVARTLAAARVLAAARMLFGLTCVFYGASHFVYADYTASMVPRWLPGSLGLAYFTGIAHVVAGTCLIVKLVPWLAATFEALMLSSFGLLVWVPSFFMQPRPKWARPPGNQWSELVVTLLLATSAWLLAASLRTRAHQPDGDLHQHEPTDIS